jgi:uncharacterized protein (DUF169 family)
VAKKWKEAMPFTRMSKKYVVFKPLNEVVDAIPPDIVCIFANPDQISVLVTMSGYSNGLAQNMLAPFGASCHSILFAYQEIGKEHPKAILGFFDIAQRYQIPKDILSFTLPYQLYQEIEECIDESCLTTHAWKKIEGR